MRSAARFFLSKGSESGAKGSEEKEEKKTRKYEDTETRGGDARGAASPRLRVSACRRRRPAGFSFGLAHPRPVTGNDDTATRHQFAAAAERRSIDHGNRGFSQLFEAAKDRMKRLKHLEDRLGDMLFDGNPGAE